MYVSCDACKLSCKLYAAELPWASARLHRTGPSQRLRRAGGGAGNDECAGEERRAQARPAGQQPQGRAGQAEILVESADAGAAVGRHG